MSITKIAYSKIEGFDAEMFRCDAWRATLSVPTCAKRRRTAQTATEVKAEGLERCMRCPIGASHAGEAHVERSSFYGGNICPRCRRGTVRRMIGASGAARCISCFNREAEVKKRRDGRGNVPGLQLHARRISIVLDHGSATKRQVDVGERYTLDIVELALAALRLATGKIAFARPIGGTGISLTELAKQVWAVKAKPLPTRARHHRVARHVSAPASILSHDIQPALLQGVSGLASRAGLGRVPEQGAV